MKLRKITAAAMCAMLAMLGYSCSTDDPTEEPFGQYLYMYGPPIAKIVKSECHIDGRIGGYLGYALKNIKVEIGEVVLNENRELVDLKVKKTVKTDKYGKFSADVSGKDIGIRFIDVDGEENGGEYETMLKRIGEFVVTSYKTKGDVASFNVTISQNLKKNSSKQCLNSL